jgi:hypothetical protein
MHDLGGATDELVNRFAKRTDVALKRLRDQGIGKRFKLGVEHGLEPTATLFPLRAELRLPGQAATSALLIETFRRDVLTKFSRRAPAAVEHGRELRPGRR